MSSRPHIDAPLQPLRECRIIQLPKIADLRGNLTVVESRRHVPFQIRRAYWVYDVPGGEDRGGGHAYYTLQEFIIALSGSFSVTVDDGTAERVFQLNRSYFGLWVPSTLWRRIDNFSTNAVCLVFASAPYNVDEYIRDRELFGRWRAERAGEEE
jgi:uncharacterized cupin superfamily protein